MKNSIKVLAFAALINTAYAQDKPLLPMCVIINGSVNLTSLQQYDYFFSSEANAGFGAGASFRTDGDFYLLGGIQYVSVNPTLTNNSIEKSEKVTMQLFQVPLMGGVQILKSDDSKQCMHMQLGASLSSLLSVSDNELGIEKDNLWDTGFTVKTGIGADLGMFVIDINYNLLLTHVYETPGYNNKAKLRCWELCIGYKINIGDK